MSTTDPRHQIAQALTEIQGLANLPVRCSIDDLDYENGWRAGMAKASEILEAALSSSEEIARPQTDDVDLRLRRIHRDPLAPRPSTPIVNQPCVRGCTLEPPHTICRDIAGDALSLSDVTKPKESAASSEDDNRIGHELLWMSQTLRRVLMSNPDVADNEYIKAVIAKLDDLATPRVIEQPSSRPPEPTANVEKSKCWSKSGNCINHGACNAADHCIERPPEPSATEETPNHGPESDSWEDRGWPAPTEAVCERCQMRVPERLATWGIGVRGGTAARCAACRPCGDTPELQAANKAEVVAMRKARR